MYVAVKGGEAAIANAHRLLADRRRGDRAVPALRLDQIVEQLGLAVDRVMARRLALRPRAGRARHQAGARRPDRGDLPRARLSHHAAALRLFAADRHRRDADRAPHLGDLQGPARRPVARPDLRLHPPPARSGAGRRTSASPSRRSAAADGRGDAARHRPPRRRGPDRAGRRRCRRTTSPATSPASRWSSRSTATCACRRWRAATRAFCWRSAIRRSAAMAAPIPSSAKSASARSRSSSTCPNSASPCRSAASASPSARWSTSSRARPRRRRSSPAATAWSSASASARRCPWRWSTGRCGPRELGEDIVAPAQDEEFVISHSDNVQATGFVEHLKLPHYVDFQAELDLVRRMRARVRGDATQDDRHARRPRNERNDQPSPPTTSPISTSRPSG